MDEPNNEIPYTDKPDPIRAKLRKDKDEPRCMKSSTDNDDPSNVMPNTDNALPTRLKLRSETVDPKHTKSRSDSDELRRSKP